MNGKNNNTSSDTGADLRAYPFERFASIRSYTSFNFLKADPSWIIYTADTNGQFNLWRQRSKCTG